MATVVLPRYLRVIGRTEFGPALVLVVISIVFQVKSGGLFFTNLELAGATSIAAAVGTIGIGVTFLMISAEFDLSVSAVYALTPVIMAEMQASPGWNEWIAFAVAMVAAAGIGMINGLITTRFAIPSFIATLGSLFVITGLLFYWTGGNPLPYPSPGSLNHILGGPIGTTPFSAPVVWMLFWMIVVWYVLQRTTYGNWTFAAGGRLGVARAMGVPVRNVKLGNFILCSFLAGFAGCTQYAQLGIVSSGFGENYNLIAIVAAVLGGASLFGVIGSIPGTVIGALILGSLETGLVLVGAPSSWYTSFIGLILIAAVIANNRLSRFEIPRARGLSAPSQEGAPLFELRGVEMDFGSIRALEDISMHLRAGEVVGVVGDNGAGKSTLVKILTGYHRPTAGRLSFLGENVHFRSPHQARAAGIEAVYQDLALLDELSLWRNFFMGKELRRRRASLSMLRVNEMREICLRELMEMGLTRVRSADEVASSLSGGERQSLAIRRAVHFGARVLILDEPTAALSVKETRQVFATIDAARHRGLGVIYIDHNMGHVHPLADRIVFLEHGRIRSTFAKGEVSLEDLIELIALSGTGASGLAHDTQPSTGQET